MRVLVATTAGVGHFGPMVPFAQACRAAGHDVVVAAPRSFEPAVVAAGLAFAPLGEPSPAELGAIFGRLEGLTLDEANVIVLRARLPRGRRDRDDAGDEHPGRGGLPGVRHCAAPEKLEHAGHPSVNAETMPFSRPALYEGR